MSEANQTETCQYCDKTFFNKYNLIRHQKNSKKCLELQYGKNNIPYKHNCQYCNYKTNTKINYDSHLKNCKEHKKSDQQRIQEMEKELFRLKVENESILSRKEKDEEIIRLKVENELIRSEKEFIRSENTELKKQAFKPKTNIINNMLFNLQLEHSKKVLSPYEELEKNFEKIVKKEFTEEMFKKGADGVCSFLQRVASYDDKKWLISYENTKKNFHTKIEDKIRVDDRANSFISKIFPYIKKMSKKHYKKLNEEFQSNQSKIEKLNKKKNEIHNIGIRGSSERNKCIQVLSNELCVSNTKLKMNTINGDEVQSPKAEKDESDDDGEEEIQVKVNKNNYSESEDESSEYDEESDPFLNPPSDDDNGEEENYHTYNKSSAARRYDSNDEEIMDDYNVA